MNRRRFAQGMGLAALVAAVAPPPIAAEPQDAQPAPFPLSVMLWTVFRGLPFEERLAKVREAGYSNVELVGEYAQWTPAEFDRANAVRRRLGISFDATAGMKHSLADPGQREDFLTELSEALAPMQTLGCPAMIVLSGNAVPGLSREAQHASCVEGLKHAAEIIDGKQVEGRPVRLLLECIDPEENPHYFLPSASEAIAIVRAVNHPQVQFLYDLYHEQIAEGNLMVKLEKHIDVIGLIHVADVPGRHAPGTGEIHYANIYRKLADLQYKHAVAMEFLPKGDAVAELQRARQELEAACAWLNDKGGRR